MDVKELSEIKDYRIDTLQAPIPLDRVPLKELFNTFLILGFTAFGGALMIAYIKRLIVDEKKWLTERDFLDGFALCQTIPGSTLIQMSSYIGLKLKGAVGAIISFIGFILPSFIFIMLFSYFYALTINSMAIKEIFADLQTVIIALMLQSLIVVGKMNLKNLKSLFIALLAAILFWLNINPFKVIILSVIAGIIIFDNISLADSLATKTSGMLFKNVKPIFYLILFLTAIILFSYLIDKNLFNLVSVLIRISILSFGNGYAGTSLMFKEIVQNHHLISPHTFLNGMIFGRITPGPGMISVFIGFMVFGFLGAIIAMISQYLPAIIILFIAEPIFNRFKFSNLFQKFILGILSSFVGLIVNVIFDFAHLIIWDIKQFIILVFSFVVLSFKISPVWVILIVTLFSVLYQFIVL